MSRIPPGITKTGSAKKPYQVRYRDLEQQEHQRSFAKLDEAKAFQAEQKDKVAKGTHIDPRAGQMTFREYATAWLEAQDHASSTYDIYERVFRLYAFPAFGRRPLLGLTHTMLQAWAKGLPVATTTARAHLVCVNSVLNAAVKDRKIVVNPAADVTIKGRREPVVVPTPEQRKAVEDALPERFRIIAQLVCGTGLRISEALGLDVASVDFMRGYITVTHQLARDARSLQPPKSEHAVRRLKVDPITMGLLNRHIQAFPPVEVELPDYSADRRKPVTRTVRLLFSKEGGLMLTCSVWNQRWLPAAQQAGLEKGTGIHALRHYFASLMIFRGVDPTKLAEKLGHFSATFTIQQYVHLWPEAEDKYEESLADAMAAEYGNTEMAVAQ